MCGRYTAAKDFGELIKLMGIVMARVPFFAPHYNIASNHYGWWLEDDDPRSESHKMALGHPLEEPMKIYPVSDLVNSPKTDDARCIEPVRIDRDFFERQWLGDG